MVVPSSAAVQIVSPSAVCWLLLLANQCLLRADRRTWNSSQSTLRSVSCLPGRASSVYFYDAVLYGEMLHGRLTIRGRPSLDAFWGGRRMTMMGSAGLCEGGQCGIGRTL